MLQNKKTFQADGREINLLGLIDLHVEVGREVAVQKIYVTPTLSRSKILGKDWLQVMKRR